MAWLPQLYMIIGKTIALTIHTLSTMWCCLSASNLCCSFLHFFLTLSLYKYYISFIPHHVITQFSWNLVHSGWGRQRGSSCHLLCSFDWSSSTMFQLVDFYTPVYDCLFQPLVFLSMYFFYLTLLASSFIHSSLVFFFLNSWLVSWMFLEPINYIYFLFY